MAGGSAGTDITDQLNTLFQVGVVGGLSDAQLLQRFLTARDEGAEAAFSVLVQRHGPMVLRVCRQILGDAHDAQDSFQATFLVLAHKAGSVRKADSVASWLHGVARRVAVRARADAVRRDFHERRAATMRPDGSEREVVRPEPWPELHEEVARLPEHYREPVVLCYLEGLTTEAAALRLGCPHGTVLSRLSRARDRLRRQLTRRGLTSAAGLLAAGQSPETAKVAMPSELVVATVQAAKRFTVGRGPGVGTMSTSVGVLEERVLRAMLLTKLRMIAVFIVTAGALAIAVAAFAHRGRLVGAPLQAPDAVAAPSPIAQAEERGKPEGGASIPFQKVGVGADDLIEATRLDVYKFRFEMPKGHRFRVVLRELKNGEIPGRVLYIFPFEKTQDGPNTILVSFLRRDHSLQGVLLSQETEAEFRLDSPGCDPGGIATIVPLPLAGVESTRKTVWLHKSDKENEKYTLKETRLITIVASEPGKVPPPPTSYPRGELVIMNDQ